jgi:hypothetical protein
MTDAEKIERVREGARQLGFAEHVAEGAAAMEAQYLDRLAANAAQDTETAERGLMGQAERFWFDVWTAARHGSPEPFQE